MIGCRVRPAVLAVGLWAVPAYGQARMPSVQPTQPEGVLPLLGLPGWGQPPRDRPGAREVERQLDRAKLLDAGRRLEWVWLDVHGGVEQLGLTAFGGEPRLTAGLVATSGSGALIGAGLGARLLYVTVLARGRIGFVGLGQRYSAGLELGFHVPLGRFEPHAEVGGGYTALANLQDGAGGVVAQAIAIRGGYARMGVGLDLFVLPVLSLGVGLSAELLGLTRAALSSDAMAAIQASPVASAAAKANAASLAEGAGGVGGAIAVTAVVGLHY